MVEKKESYGKKLRETRIKILAAIIDEEIDNTLLSEQYDDVSTPENSSHGIHKFTDRSTFTGTLLSPVSDVWNAVKLAGAKAGVQVAGMAGFLFSGGIAALLPFNDPRTVNWLGARFRYWEQQNLKLIDQQFERELGVMRAGWDTFRTDFWNIGFIASPLSVVAAIAGVNKAVDLGFSVLNVATAGWAEKKLNQLVGDIEDPGDLGEYLTHGEHHHEEQAEKNVRSAVRSRRAIEHLEDRGYVDPDCLGANERDMFPAGPHGTEQFIRFVQRNASRFNQVRRNKFASLYPGNDARYDNIFLGSKNTKDAIEDWLSSNSFITEGKVGKIGQQTPPVIRKTGLPGFDSLTTKLVAWVAQGKMTQAEAQAALTGIVSRLLADPAAQAKSQAWSSANLGYLTKQTVSHVNGELLAAVHNNQVRVTPQEQAAYNSRLPTIIDRSVAQAVNLSKKKLGSKGVDTSRVVLPPAARTAIQRSVGTR